jgi:hypothetical protein
MNLAVLPTHGIREMVSNLRSLKAENLAKFTTIEKLVAYATMLMFS